jgi:hypothetical protein
MLNKIFGLFGKSTSSLKDQLEKAKLVGNLYEKEIGRKKKVLADECTLFLSIESDSPINYNLNVVSEENEDESKTSFILDKSYSINSDCNFMICKEKGRDVLIWEKNKKFYMFYMFVEESNLVVKDLFFDILSILIASHEENISYDEAAKKGGNKAFISDEGKIDDISDFLDKNYSSSSSSVKKSDAGDLVKDFSKLAIQLNFKEAFPKANCLFESKGNLYKYDKTTDNLVCVSQNCFLGIYYVESFNYYLVINENDTQKTFTQSIISQDLNLITNRSENLIMWLSNDNKNSNEKSAYNFVFLKQNQVDPLRKVITKCQYESSNREKFEDLKEEERNYLENENVSDEEVYDDDKDVEMEIQNDYQESANENLNRFTAQAYLHDRTFVVRDDKTIGVYKTTEQDELLHLANLPAVLTYDNKDLDISEAQMFYSDTNMMLLDKNNKNSLFRYDLGKGKIVEEWTADEMKNIDQIIPEKKFDQMTDNPILIGVNKNNLFAMDSRINKKNKVVNVKNYKTNPKMNCLATTDFGGIATGSTNGEIRLYDQIGKNAKTLLPCFGDKINSIDTTADGRFILATCDKYLILVPTAFKGDKNGFLQKMGKDKPNPKTLKIKPIDINKYSLENLTFTPAKFNVNQVDGETNIITSMGEYVVIWNFTKIKKGILDDYKIKRVHQNVVGNQFKYNKNQILVTMDNKLRIQNQKKMFGDK